MKPLRKLILVLWVCSFAGSFLSSTSQAQEHWDATGGPPGGQIYSLTRTPDGILFAGTNEGIFRSSDIGLSWEASNVGAPQTWPTCLTSHPDGTVFAAYLGYGVFRTTNSGRSWFPVNSGLGDWGPPTFGVNAYVVTIGPRGQVLCGTNRGIIRSTDDGENWDFATPTVIAHAMTFDSSGHVFAGTWDQTLFSSTDDGRSWIQNQAAPGAGLFYTLGVSPNGSLFLGTQSGIFRSTDAGQAWLPRNSGLTDLTIGAVVFDSGGFGFAGTGKGVHKSTNNGDTWTLAGSSAQAIGGNGLVTDGGSMLVVGTFDGVYRSSNGGGTWALATEGIPSSVITALALEEDSCVIGSTNLGRFMRTTDNGSTWGVVGEIGAPIYQVAPANNGIILAGGFRGVYRSADKGASWSRSSNGLSDTTIQSLVVLSDGAAFVGTLQGGVYRSLNGGAMWAATNTGLASLSVASLAVHPSGSVFAATSAGVYKTADKGNTWTACAPIPGGAITPSSIAISASGDLYAYSGYQFFHSVDNGASWQYAGYSGVFVQAIRTDAGNDFVACGPSGVLRGAESGSCLRQINDGLANTSTNCVLIGPDGRLFAGTNGSGVYRTRQPLLVAAENIVRNAQFASGTEQWTLFTNGEASFTAATPVWERNGDCHAASVLILTTGTGEFLYQTDLTLHAGRRYRLSFRGLCTTGHDVDVDVMKQSVPYTTYGFVSARFDLDPFWQEYSIDFTASRFSGTANDAMLRFRFNGNDASGDTYFLDDVYVRELPESGPPQILAQPADDIARVGSPAQFTIGVSGTEPFAYQWYRDGRLIPGGGNSTYITPPVVLTDDSSAYQCRISNASGTVMSAPAVLRVTSGVSSLLANGDFEHGTADWLYFADVAGGSAFDTDVAGPHSTHAAHIAVNAPASNMQLYQPGVALKEGKLYRLSFRAYSNNGHDMEIWLHQHDDPYAPYGLKGVQIGLETDWKTYFLEFTTTNIIDSVSDGRLRFWFAPYAEAGDHYFIDDVLLESYEPTRPTTSVSLESPIPNVFSLSQSYPNPANPSATVRYALPVSASVRLVVYDMLGQQVAVLVDGTQEAGYHQVTFDGSDLASGVYLYRLSTERSVATKKLMLVK